jgi:hypothetical protein
MPRFCICVAETVNESAAKTGPASTAHSATARQDERNNMKHSSRSDLLAKSQDKERQIARIQMIKTDRQQPEITEIGVI